jgi:hypothetical protein
MTARRNPPPHRFVYVIGPTVGLQKIGLATDPRARLAALQTASPFQLLLHGAVRVPFGEAHAVEQAAHRALAGCRASGEWFRTTAGEAVAAVRGAAAADSPAVLHKDMPLPLFAYTAQSPPGARRSSPTLRWIALRQVCRGLGGRGA